MFFLVTVPTSVIEQCLVIFVSCISSPGRYVVASSQRAVLAECSMQAVCIATTFLTVPWTCGFRVKHFAVVSMKWCICLRKLWGLIIRKTIGKGKAVFKLQQQWVTFFFNLCSIEVLFRWWWYKYCRWSFLYLQHQKKKKCILHRNFLSAWHPFEVLQDSNWVHCWNMSGLLPLLLPLPAASQSLAGPRTRLCSFPLYFWTPLSG